MLHETGMVQGPHGVRPVAAGVPERLVDPAAPDGGGDASARRPTAAAVDVVAAPAGTVAAAPFARLQALRIELVRAETVLQIAQQAVAAVEVSYAGMRDLAGIAGGPDLTQGERSLVDAAFRILKRNIDAIVGTTAFDGEPILAGGDGPDGAYRLGRFGGVPAGEDAADPLPPVLIPPVALLDAPDGAAEPVLLAAEAAVAAGRSVESALRITRRQGHAIEGQRAALQEIYAAEIESGRTLGDYVSALASPEGAEQLSRLVSDIVRDGGGNPFDNSADRMRAVLQQSPGHDDPPAAPKRITPAAAEPVSAAPVSAVSGPGHRVTPEEIPAGPQDGAVLSGEPAVPAGGGRTAETPSSPTATQRAAAPRAGPSAASVPPLADMEAVSTEAAAPIHRFGPPAAGPDELVPAALPGAAPIALSRLANGRPQGAVPLPGAAAARRMDAERPAERSTAAPYLAAAFAPGHARDRAAEEIYRTELPRIAELDASRRAAGLIHQGRDAEVRPDAGLAVVRTVYQPPADRARGFGDMAAFAPDGVMAELVRADSLLQAADTAIEQMDLHLDYLRGLAEEAAAGASRDRGALDGIFQTVKTDILDRLALTTESQGERMLAGGNGPGGDYVIRMPDGGAAGDARDIAIPSMRLGDLAPGLDAAHIRTRDEAAVAVGHIEAAGTGMSDARDTIAGARTLVHRLMSVEIAQLAARAPLARSALGL